MRGASHSLPLPLARPRVLMDLSRPRLLISRSPWNFYQFLSSDVPRFIFPKIPRGSRRFFFLTSSLYSYCLFMGLPTAPSLFALSLFLYLHSFHSLCPLIFPFPPSPSSLSRHPHKPLFLSLRFPCCFPHSPRLSASL